MPNSDPAFRLNEAQSVFFDYTRGLAALAVLIGHAAELFLRNNPLHSAGIQVGGVFVFFLLSGFLIAYSVFRRYDDPTYSFRHFFIDRFARIFTAFIPALLLVALADHYILSLPAPPPTESTRYIAGLYENAEWQHWLGNLFMLQDFPIFQVARLLHLDGGDWFIRSYGSSAPFWTVSIEWWLYMLFGMVVLLRLRRGQPFPLWQLAILGFVAIEPAYYFVGGVNNCLTLLWLIGMFACLGYKFWPLWCRKLGWEIGSRRYILGLILAVLGGLLAMAIRLLAIKLDIGTIRFAELQFGLFMGLALFAFFLLMGCISHVSAWFKTIGTFLANYSFSLYLTHYTVLTYLYVKTPVSHAPATFWQAIIYSNLLAIVFWWLFERHYPKVGRWLKSRF